MSGGSYDYLHLKDLGAVIDSPEVRRMAERLDGLGYHDVANETRLFDLESSWMLRFLEARRAQLESIWKAVDRLDSSDAGPDEVAETVAAYRVVRERLNGR